MAFGFNLGIYIHQRLGHDRRFFLAYIAGRELYLALQIGKLDHIIIYYRNMADTRSGKVKPSRTAQAARANNRDFGCRQSLLSRPANLLEHKVTGIAIDIVGGHLIKQWRA